MNQPETLPGRPLDQTPSPGPSDTGLGPGAVVAIAIVTLLLGGVIGFFVGRAAEADDGTSAASPLTSPSTAPTTRPPGDTIPQSPTTTAPAAPPSTDLDPTTIGTPEEPIPVGQAYVLGLYEIEVLGVVRDAAELLQDHDPSNPTPPSGQQHVVVEIAIRYTEDNGRGNPGAVPFFVTDGTTEWHDYVGTCGSVPDSLWSYGGIEEGEEAVGNTCFTVPSDTVGDLLLGTEGFSGPVYFALP